ncbi:integrator complex subunit 5-like [Ciona intestinalis]
MPVSTGMPANAKTKQSSKQHGALQMVHWFVASCYTSGSFTEERVQSSVMLLRRVPASRHAVLHRFSALFEEAVRLHLDHMEYQASAQGISPEIAGSLELVIKTLMSLLQENGKAWAPILCKWSVDSLGEISSCCKQRQVVPSPTDLDSLLRFWLNLIPMRMLLDTYRACIKILIVDDPGCVDTLLTSSCQHSPYFDWVVADVGAAFPHIVAQRILYSGFDKFCALRFGNIEPSASVSMNENEQSVLSSVVRVLEHLVRRNKDKVCSIMLLMYKQSGKVKAGNNTKMRVALYLMQLFSMSNILLRSTTVIFLPEIDGSSLNNLHQQYESLGSGAAEIETLCSLVVHLVCQSGVGSYQLIRLILDAASPRSNPALVGLNTKVQKFFRKIMPSLSSDLQHLALSKGVSPNEDNVFKELEVHYKDLCKDLLTSSSNERKNWIHTLIVALCLHQHSDIVMKEILIQSTKSSDIDCFIKLYNEMYPVLPGLLGGVLKQSFSSVPQLTKNQSTNLLSSILYMASSDFLTSAASNFKQKLRKQLVGFIDNLMTITCHLSSPIPLASLAVQILYLLMTSQSQNEIQLPTQLLPMTRCLVFYFYRLLHAGHVNNDSSMLHCQQTLTQLAQTPQTFSVVSQFLLEAAVRQNNSILFGRRVEQELDEDVDSTDPCIEHQVSLITLHRKISSNIRTRRQMVGFVPIGVETGLIGSGPKRKKKCPVSKTFQTSSNECLSLLIYRCCCKTSGGDNLCSIPDVQHVFDADKLMILSERLISSFAASSPYLATAVTLDGDMEWPVCHMRKFTIERDLKVFHFMDEHPFAWSLLQLIAHNHRALWNITPLIRSCMSVLISHFESSRESEVCPTDSLHYLSAVRIVEILGKGQIIPPPLSYCAEIFCLISPYEVYILLVILWNFIKEHPPPSDAEHLSSGRDFNKEKLNMQPYLATLHTVIHANITKLGPSAAKFTVLK